MCFVFRLHACLCIKLFDPLELEVQTDVSCHVSAGNGTQFLWKSQPVLLTTEASLQHSH